jgi:McKusick-Kaufman syndrome protein
MTNKISIYRPFVSNSDTNKLLSYLKDIKNVVQSSVGPNARLKLISQSKNVNISLTNVSKNLIKAFYNFNYLKSTIIGDEGKEEENYVKWLFDFILKTIQIHFDNYYDSGILTVYLINDFYLLNSKYSNYQNLIQESLNELISHCMETDGKCKIKFKLDLNNLKHLKVLFKSILNTKNLYRLSFKGQTDEKFLNLILQANLSSFLSNESKKDEKKYFAKINYQFYADNFKLTLNDSKLVNGVLIPVELMNNHLQSIESLMKLKANKVGFKCILFDTQLSADFEQFNLDNCSYEVQYDDGDDEKRNTFLLIQKLKTICDVLVENQVDIVFCQKVIHPSIKSYLIEKKCIPIDRLSITYVESVTELTSERKKY